jgi:hypothetical protein
MGCSERALANWEAGRSLTEIHRSRFNELKRVYDELSEVVDPDSIGDWLKSLNDEFDPEASRVNTMRSVALRNRQQEILTTLDLTKSHGATIINTMPRSQLHADGWLSRQQTTSRGW